MKTKNTKPRTPVKQSNNPLEAEKPSETQNLIKKTSETTSNTIDSDNSKQSSDEIFTVYVKCLTGATLKLQISKADSNIEMKQLLAESVETCYITNYELKINDKTLEDFADVADYPEIKHEATLTMHSALYDDKGARMHVYRLRELLDSKIDDMYLSTGSIHAKPEKPNPSFPSLCSLVSSEGYSDLANALNCDMEFQQQTIKKPEESKKKKKKEKKDKGKKNEKDTKLEQKKEMQPHIPEEYDTKRLFNPEKFSLKSLEKTMSFAQAKLPKCVNSITFSGWNPPPGNRKLCGDLFYLEIETLEGDTYHVTATPSGFYVNGSEGHANFDPLPKDKSQISQTLIGLLWKISPKFVDAFPKLLSLRTKKHPFEVTPIPFPVNQWISPKTKHSYDTNRSEEALFTVLGNDPRIQQREWNEEYQSCRELPSGTMEERIIRDRTLFKIHCDFVDAATKGAKAVVDKCLLPINPIDPEPAQVYIQNNIFFSFAVDSKHMDENVWNNRTAYVNADNDLDGVIAFTEADVRGIHTLATAVIDYRGYRVIAQSIIPGILQGEQGSKHVYGSIDEGQTFSWNEKYHALMAEAAKKLMIKEHIVLDKEGKPHKLFGPVECKGIVGSDGRFYVLDLIRTTPRDANYPDDPTALIRPELIKSFVRYKREQWEKEKKDDKKEMPPISFNLNVLTKYKLGGTEEEKKKHYEEVKELADYLVNIVIPQLIKDVESLECCPLDGFALTDALYERGINKRYLGRIAKAASHLPYFVTLCEQEMVVCAAKEKFNELLRETRNEKLCAAITFFLNALLTENYNEFKKLKKKKSKNFDYSYAGKRDIRNAIEELVELRFGYKLPSDYFQNMPKLPTLRSFCLRVGLCIACRDYDFTDTHPFSVDDILGLEPVVKHSTPKSTTAHSLLEGGKRQLSMGQYESAFEFLSQAIVMFQQVKGPMNREVATCFSYLANILFNASDLPQAILHQHKALIISKRVLGYDSSIVCHLHQLLGLLCHHFGQTEFALKHFLRARYICELNFGFDHPDMAIILVNLAMMFQDLGDIERSLKYLKKALSINERVLGPDHLQTGACHHSLAITYNFVSKFKDALRHEKEYYKILNKLFGENDQRTKESSRWLETFTQRAVQAQRESNTKELSLKQIYPHPLFGVMKKMPMQIMEILKEDKKGEKKEKQ